MSEKKVPMRRCIGCMQSKPKKELVRIVASEDGTVKTDRTGRAPGRGAYLCDKPECLALAIKKNALGRNLKISVSADAAAALRSEFEKSEKSNTMGGVVNG